MLSFFVNMLQAISSAWTMPLINFFSKIAEGFAAFKPGFSTVYSIWGTIISVAMFYKTVYLIVGAVCTRKFPTAKQNHKYGIVIAARNEKNVIGNLLDSIEKQDYPHDLLTVFVVADNCTDDGETARIAREHGAVVYERFDKEHATKGYALQFLFENIERDYGTQSFEGFFVFDADNLLKSDFITRMNEAFDSGEKIITSFRNSKNFDENWISASYALHWIRSSRLSHRARSVFRLATNIQGTGFLFASEIVKDGWKYTSLTEDRALTADAVVQGYQITYCDAAEFYDEQPTKLKIALRQRVRWAKGHIMAFGESGWGLFKNIFSYKGKSFWDTVRQRFASFDMFFLVLPSPLFVLAKKILKAFVFIIGYTVSPKFWVWTAAYFYNIIAYKVKAWFNNIRTAIYVFVFEHKRIKKISLWNKIKFSFMWPIFDIIGKYSMYVALFKKVEWKPIPHESKVSIDDVAKPHESPIPAFLQNTGRNGYIRFVAHIAFAAISFAYSFFMMGFNIGIFLPFLLVNLALIGAHLLFDLKKSTPRIVSNLLLFFTYIWNITMCCEVMGNGAIQYLGTMRMLLNLLLYSAPYMLIYAVSNSIMISGIITSVFWFIASSANFFLTSMRGRPLFLSDLFSFGTALNVAGEYKFNITAFYVFTLIYIAAMLTYFALLERSREKGYYKQRWFVRIPVNTIIVAILIVCVSSTSFLNAMGVTPYFWSHKVNGFPLNFVMDLKYSTVKAPDGYTVETIDALAEKYVNDKAEINAYDKTARPNVFVIMDESFSDLRVIGDFDTNTDVMPFTDRLCNDPSVISGYTYVSVFGGGTADSEYEFLTGDNMFMFSQGAIPYQTNFKGVTFMPSIVATFKVLGYETIATHPYFSSGWNRPNVYRAFDFDIQEYIEQYGDADKLRAYVSDQSDFEHLISLYENKETDEPLFVFNVTMQNHGGYTSKYKNFEQKIVLRNTNGKYPMAEQYLSLLHETDNALKTLITYFDECDEPTVIVFFGDHQVQVEDGFYDELYGKTQSELSEEELMKKNLTRFFIWSNFDMNTPEGYSYLANLERDLRPEPAAEEGGDATQSDITDSDVTSSDVTDSDGALDTPAAEYSYNNLNVSPVMPDRYEDVKAELAEREKQAEETDITYSDGTASDTVSSDITSSDGETEETFVTQHLLQSPQVITNLSYLSGMIFEAAGLPVCGYQKYLCDLAKTYPVITVFGVYDSEGVFSPLDKVRKELDSYAYTIFNHLFDIENRVSRFFFITNDDVKTNSEMRYKFIYRPQRWINDRKEMPDNVFDIIRKSHSFIEKGRNKSDEQ